jgi:AcrR family transcriptional regulator
MIQKWSHSTEFTNEKLYMELLEENWVRKSKKKEAILKAAQEIFSEKGLKDATITEIAKKAGVVDSIIYHYFKNKEDLLYWAFSEQMENALKELAISFKGIRGPVSKLGKMIWYHLTLNDFNTGNAEIQKNLLLECRSNQEFYNHESRNALKKYTQVLVDILSQGMEEGFFRKDLDLSVVRDMIFGLLDEESLACLSAREISETIPDFDAIMSIILSMIEARTQTNGQNGDKPTKAALVIEAAQDVFAEKSYNKSTVMEIANRAGVAEGTIYDYFKNKQDLLFAIPKEKFQFYHQQIEQAYRSDDPLIQLRCMIWNHFCLFLSDDRFLVIHLRDVKLNKQFYTSEAYSYFLNYLAPLYEILEHGKQRGIFKQEIDNRIYRNLFVGSFSHMAIRWFIHGNLSPLKVMKEFGHACELLCRAVLISPSAQKP